jgi:hypothetical protein
MGTGFRGRNRRARPVVVRCRLVGGSVAPSAAVVRRATVLSETRRRLAGPGPGWRSLLPAAAETEPGGGTRRVAMVEFREGAPTQLMPRTVCTRHERDGACRRSVRDRQLGTDALRSAAVGRRGRMRSWMVSRPRPKGARVRGARIAGGIVRLGAASPDLMAKTGTSASCPGSARPAVARLAYRWLGGRAPPAEGRRRRPRRSRATRRAAPSAGPRVRRRPPRRCGC